ncbi:MAG TPA: thermonuclease family protein [Solirubrobacterales bacterium]|nr:thermonuclease family protein [Solirubrobacterales bacterium]
MKLAAILLCLSILAWVGCGETGKAEEGGSRSATVAVVDYAVDGDTLRVRLPSGRLAYVRLVGIDTPEDVKPGAPVECGAEDAAASMRALAPEGASVVLHRDSVADAKDRYGRILAHAFIAGRQLELSQLRRGWAEVYRFEGQRFDGLARFEHAEGSARRAGRGVWSSCGGDFHSAR